jgi:dolichol-phosphate mannosyltransferase
MPVFNERDGIDAFLKELFGVLGALGRTYEVLAVNDGSTDGTTEALNAAAGVYPALRVVHFRRNFGQTAALMAGFDLSRSAVVVPIDGDGQNDPSAIESLLREIDSGFDVVSGWRRDRQDASGRVLTSRVANRLISAISGVRLNDYGCTLKAYRREVLDGVRLYGELHRFIPIFASWQGARVTEIPTKHRPRTAGRSKYGFGRIGRVLLDLMLVAFLERAASRPLHLFGGVGLLAFAAAAATGLWALWLKVVGNVSFISTPLPLLIVMFLVLSVLSLFTGLLAELVMRTYYESQDKKPYVIRSLLNFDT